jgi:hypothetical protein
MASSDFKKLVVLVDKNNKDFSNIKEKNNDIVQELEYLILAKNSADKEVVNLANTDYNNSVIKYTKIEEISEVNIKEWSISSNRIYDLLSNMLIEMEKQDIEKFIIKMNKIDPITGESRYGPEMCKKIKYNQEIIIQLIENIKKTINILEEKINIYKTNFPAIIEPVIEIKEPLETVFKDINKNEIDEIEFKKRKQEEGKIIYIYLTYIFLILLTLLFILELLRIEADKIRLKKQLELERIELRKKELHETILEINKISKINLNVKTNLYNLMNNFNVSNNIDNKQRIILINFLINLLNNIISKPDDILLRKLKVINPTIFDKVITIQYGNKIYNTFIYYFLKKKFLINNYYVIFLQNNHNRFKYFIGNRISSKDRN